MLGANTVMLAGARAKGRLLSSCFTSAFSRKENNFQKEKKASEERIKAKVGERREQIGSLNKFKSLGSDTFCLLISEA